MSDELPGDLQERAIRGYRAHLECVNAADLEGVRRTMFNPPLAAGEPFDVYAAGMMRIAPVRLLRARATSACVGPTALGERTSIMLDVEVETTEGRQTGAVYVWCLPDGREFVASKNSHWYLGSQREAQSLPPNHAEPSS